ncbi:MAG: LD-carboxypeptidase [Prevotellaceae bacterium]|jgi:muramoyltetrapeptide carboxypeptidase|nr:LD-carboxypeptidase [Prevotellaceae bacterium]
MYPPFLKFADKVAIVSPSGTIDSKYIDGAVKRLTEWGLQPVVSKHARGSLGRYSGTPEQRAADLQEAIDDKEIKAIFCSRGGYGLVQIIDRIDFTAFELYPKWIVGFSDISVLHSVVNSFGIVSMHAGMARQLCEQPADSELNRLMHNALFGTELPNYSGNTHPLNRIGQVHSQVVGGNLSVLFSLRGTHFDLDCYQKILFIEDVGEKPYHIDRMMQNLKMGGVLENLSGLIVGQFSDYDEDPSMGRTVYELIADSVADYDYPVLFDFPAGHIERNLPLLTGAKIQLTVNSEGVSLKY